MEYKSVFGILFAEKRLCVCVSECYSNIPLTIFGFCEKFLRYRGGTVGMELRKYENICGR